MQRQMASILFEVRRANDYPGWFAGCSIYSGRNGNIFDVQIAELQRQIETIAQQDEALSALDGDSGNRAIGLDADGRGGG